MWSTPKQPSSLMRRLAAISRLACCSASDRSAPVRTIRDTPERVSVAAAPPLQPHCRTAPPKPMWSRSRHAKPPNTAAAAASPISLRARWAGGDADRASSVRCVCVALIAGYDTLLGSGNAVTARHNVAEQAAGAAVEQGGQIFAPTMSLCPLSFWPPTPR